MDEVVFEHYKAIAFASNPQKIEGGQYAGMSAVLTFAWSTGRNALVNTLRNQMVNGVRNLHLAQ
jgi:hypothetical protein